LGPDLDGFPADFQKLNAGATSNNIKIEQSGVTSLSPFIGSGTIKVPRGSATGAWIADLYTPGLVESVTPVDANREYLDLTFHCLVNIKELQF